MKLLSIIILLLVTNLIHCQNLISNGSFEETYTYKEGKHPKDWNVEWGPNWWYEGEWEHEFPSNCNPPIPFNGERYLKFYLGSNNPKLESNKLQRSYFCSKLKSTLIKNQKYLIQFYTQLPKNERRGFNCFSIGFSKNPYDRRKKNLDSILYKKNSYYTSKDSWELTSFIYVASGLEKYISLGNFLEYSQINYTKRFKKKSKECSKIGGKKTDYQNYLYIDSISILAIDSNYIKHQER